MYAKCAVEVTMVVAVARQPQVAGRIDPRRDGDRSARDVVTGGCIRDVPAAAAVEVESLTLSCSSRALTPSCKRSSEFSHQIVNEILVVDE
jgi:hypothetical protein